jgi:hypothetical protein
MQGNVSEMNWKVNLLLAGIFLSVRVTFTTDLSAVESLLTRFPDAFSPGTSQPLRDAVDRSGEIYLDAMDERFGEQEAGGWEPLRGVTIRQRQRQGFPGRQPILRRYGEVRRGLRRGAQANVFRQLADGLDVGIGGDARHSPYPGDLDRPQLSIGAIAEIHQLGKGNVPIREILIDPSIDTHNAMVGAQVEGVNQSINSLSTT